MMRSRRALQWLGAINAGATRVPDYFISASLRFRHIRLVCGIITTARTAEAGESVEDAMFRPLTAAPTDAGRF